MASFSDEEDMEDQELESLLMKCKRPKIFRYRPNHFEEWDDFDFYNRFRLSKESAMMVLDLIRNDIESVTNWNHALSPECMLLLTLRFYASGGMLISVGDFCGVSKSSACRVIKKVSHYIAKLISQFIKMPTDEEERLITITQFYNIAKFPRTIAAMDCTHVRIQSPGGNNAEIFRNRKGFFSFNVQTLNDSQLKILDIVARWPGSSHDSTIFNNSKICARFESGEFDDCLIVADGGYPSRKFILTPLRNCQRPEENLYNESQIRTRNCAERLYGVWKRRFPVLAIGMRLKLKTIQSIMVATAILHNICVLNKDKDPPPLPAWLEEQVNFVNSMPSDNNDSADAAISTRNILIDSYFKNLL